LALALALSLLTLVGRVGPAPLTGFALAGFATCGVILGLSYGAWQAWWQSTIVMAGLALALACRKEHS
jgi:hypothetical protein